MSIEDFETVKFPQAKVTATRGNAGLHTQCGGLATTVSVAAEATGGMHGGEIFAQPPRKQ